jgi:hypothetical protein
VVRRVAVLLAATVVAVWIAGETSSAKLPGFVIARGKASAKNALVVAHGQVDRPKVLYARFTGKVKEGSVLVECLVGGEPTTRTYARNRAALFRFPVVPLPADVCHVTATISGRGPLVAELRAVR